METVTDRITQFSVAVALIYETHMGDSQREEMKRAICALLDADELVIAPNAQSFDDLRIAHYDLGTGGETADPAAHDSQNLRSVGHILSLDIAGRDSHRLKLLVLRNPDRAPFTECDPKWLSLLQPHLQNARFIEALMPEGVFGCAAGSHLVQSMFEGLVITTIDGEIEWLNPTARQILAASQGLMCVNGRLRAGRAFETTQIEASIREAACGRAGVMLVGHTSMWLPYGLVFAPLEFDFKPASTARGRGFVLVTIKDMRRHVEVIVERLAAVFGLTKAEQRIGALLLTGYGLQAAAAMTGKSLTTVKKQLRSMLTKTGTHNQAELLSMFLSVPSLI